MSETERACHAALARLSERAVAMRAGLAELRTAARGQGAEAPGGGEALGAGDARGCGGEPPASEAGDDGQTEAALELRRQGRVMERLVLSVREARDKIDAALA